MTHVTAGLDCYGLADTSSEVGARSIAHVAVTHVITELVGSGRHASARAEVRALPLGLIHAC